jgi:serine/threonine-protein kinase
VETAVSIILQALDGLEYAHNAVLTTKDKRGELKKVKGLVHRDLKPANIFLSGSGNAQTAKVADFGLAKAFRGSGLSGLTATGTAAGSPWFMPRAQVLNFKYSKPTVDVWGMTATLYCMLTLAFPRNFRKGADPWMVVLKEKPVPILMRRKGLPPRLAEVIDEALMDEDGQAFDSAGAFKKALEAAFR